MAAKYRAMVKYLLLVPLFLSMALVPACSSKTKPEDPAIWQKVKFDLNRLDENGLAGPADGKVSVSYEFCIPADEKLWGEVQKLDKSAKLQKGSPGRIGCDKTQWLVIGATHQKNYRQVLYGLASKTYITDIREAFFE